MRYAILVALLLASGCAHTPLDIDAHALEARNRMNELSEDLAELKTPILFFCGMVGEDDKKCIGLRALYERGRSAIDSAQVYIDAFSKTGQGLAIVDAGLGVIEAAVDEVKDETERLIEEARQHVAGVSNPGNEDSGAGSGSDSGASGQPGPATEGEGSSEAAEPSGDRGSADAAPAREVEAPGEGQAQ